MPRPFTEEEGEWLRENWEGHRTAELVAMMRERFGRRTSPRAISSYASRHGFATKEAPLVNAERVVRWGEHPEWLEWVRDHDRGMTRAQLAGAFEEEWGFRLTASQVTSARWALGTAERRDWSGHRDGKSKPIGTRRDTGKGYVLVKVREHPDVPGTRDNWEMEHVIAWERANGRRLPEGHQVMFADGDHSNLDPENLVAVPKELAGIMNSIGVSWSDRESLEECVEIARLRRRMRDVEMRPRRCAVCGREFVPRSRESRDSMTCPDCVDAGHKAVKRRSAGTGV